jgi:hypothetical protein
VIKSYGKEPPKLDFNLANITAKLSGEICLAASILKPEKPIPKSVVK